MANLVSVVLPALESIGSGLSVSSNGRLETIALAELVSVGHDSGYSLYFAALPELTSLDIGSLELHLFGQGVHQFHGRDEVLRLDATPQGCCERTNARPPGFLPEPSR